MRVFVAVPVLLGRLQVKVDAGVHWSSVDRYVLWALKDKPRTIAELAAEAGLKPRLAAEMVFRLMQVGWVEMAPDTLAFRASLQGEQVLHLVSGLPGLPREEARPARVVIEPVRGAIFAANEVDPRIEQDVRELAGSHDVRWLVERGAAEVRLQELDEVVQRGMRHGEEFLWIVRGELVRRYLVVAVQGESIDGLPATAPAELTEQVKALGGPSGRAREAVIARAPRETGLRRTVTGVAVEAGDVVLDGEAQKRLFAATLRRAHHRVLVHSTFLSVAGFERVREDLRAAARNGAKIEIFYGADRDEQTRRSSRNAAMEIAELIKADPALRMRARMHLQTTRSHAKLVVADSGTAEDWMAIVGSCNWLSTGFHRVEGSVVLRDGRLVGAVVDEMRELCFAAQIALGDELHRLAWELGVRAGPAGDAEVRLVLGDEHALMMDAARDTARSRIWAAGDRFSHAGEGQSLVPLIAAAKKGVRGRVLFSRVSGLVTDEDIADLEMVAQSHGVELTEVGDRVLHGKLLLWDDDEIVVTSLNWSSASTRASNPWGEIGVHVRMPGLAGQVAGQLDACIAGAREETRAFRREHRRDRRGRAG